MNDAPKIDGAAGLCLTRHFCSDKRQINFISATKALAAALHSDIKQDETISNEECW